MPAVNPEVLKWARTTAGLSLDEAARRIQLSAAYGKSAAQRLAEMETGDAEPTRSQLHKMAKHYNRPIITFYLKSPPVESDRGQDFRTLPHPVDDLTHAHLDTLLRDVKASQEIVRDLLEDEETEPLPFIGSASIDQQPQQVANDIIATIGFDRRAFRSARSVTEAFDYLRDKVQDAGIFVILARNLGHHNTNIAVDVFRGFVISDDIAPFVVINDGDARTAWSFTLLHEVVHLWLGTTGISGGIYTNHAVEMFCNQVAGMILLAQDELKHIQFAGMDEAAAVISQFAQERNISRSMVAYKLYLDHVIDSGTWKSLSAQFAREWHEGEVARRKKEKEKSGGPDYYRVRRSKLGSKLTDLAGRAIGSGSLTPSKASIVLLGVKPTSVHQLVSTDQR